MSRDKPKKRREDPVIRRLRWYSQKMEPGPAREAIRRRIREHKANPNRGTDDG